MQKFRLMSILFGVRPCNPETLVQCHFFHFRLNSWPWAVPQGSLTLLGANSSKTKVRQRDEQPAEFERPRFLGDDIRAAPSTVALRGPSRPTSILLDPAMVEKLRKKGAKRALEAIRRLLKLIVAEHVGDAQKRRAFVAATRGQGGSLPDQSLMRLHAT